MIKIDIISGFLGAGKTTLIKRLLSTHINNEKVILIENEFGEIGIDAEFLQDVKIDVKELNQGCICCSLQGDFAIALNEVISKYNPDRVIIEPSGVGKLSDIVKAVVEAKLNDVQLNALVCVCDANKAKMYLKNFGEFYIDQVSHAKTIFLSRADVASEIKMQECLEIVREINDEAVIVTTPINELTDEALINSYEARNSDFEKELLEEVLNNHEEHECCCGHHDHEEDHECCCGHHDHEEENECCCGHHDHEEEHECCCGHHDHEEEHECCCGHHDHEEGHECCCGHHDHEEEHECCCEHHDHEEEHECCCGHHDHEEGHDCSCGHHHDADEVFTSFGFETAHKYSADELENILNELSYGKDYGMILRSKGIVNGVDGWYHFDMVPEESNIRHGEASSVGKIVVIGSDLNKELIKKLFLK